MFSILRWKQHDPSWHFLAIFGASCHFGQLLALFWAKSEYEETARVSDVHVLISDCYCTSFGLLIQVSIDCKRRFTLWRWCRELKTLSIIKCSNFSTSLFGTFLVYQEQHNELWWNIKAEAKKKVLWSLSYLQKRHEQSLICMQAKRSLTLKKEVKYWSFLCQEKNKTYCREQRMWLKKTWSFFGSAKF